MMKNNKKSKKRKQITALLLATLLVFQNVEIGVANIVDGDSSIDAAVETTEESEVVQIEETDTELEKETDDSGENDKKEWQEEQQKTTVEEMEIFLDESMEVQEEDIIAKAASGGKIISGSCGENLTFVVDDGVLTISGSGDMWDYERWHNNSSWRSVNKVVIEDGVTYIGHSAFSECNNLLSVEIPPSVTSISNKAFFECSSLTSVEIPSSVTSIGISAFSGCSSLKSIKISSGVTSIGDSAFYRCSSLTSVEIPSSVINIGSVAFSECSNLKIVKISSGVTNIKSWAFSRCSNLMSVEIPSSIVSMERGVFFKCSNLISVEIPSSITSIESEVFSECSSLMSVEIPSSVTSINYGAFSGCTSLTNIVIPSSVTHIDEQAFSGCISLTSIEIPSGMTEIGLWVFSGCSSLINVEIPSSVTSIGTGAFLGCSSLMSVEIPSSVISIGNEAFSGCDKLSIIKILNSDCSITRSSIPSSTVIYSYAGSRVEFYAKEYGRTFVDLKEDIISKISFTSDSGTFSGENIGFFAFIYLKDGVTATNEEWTTIINSITWTSSNTSVAEDITWEELGNTVSSSKVILISVKPKTLGTTIITGTLPSGATVSYKITVIEEDDEEDKDFTLRHITGKLENVDYITGIVSIDNIDYDVTDTFDISKAYRILLDSDCKTVAAILTDNKISQIESVMDIVEPKVRIVPSKTKLIYQNGTFDEKFIVASVELYCGAKSPYKNSDIKGTEAENISVQFSDYEITILGDGLSFKNGKTSMIETENNLIKMGESKTKEIKIYVNNDYIPNKINNSLSLKVTTMSGSIRKSASCKLSVCNLDLQQAISETVVNEKEEKKDINDAQDKLSKLGDTLVSMDKSALEKFFSNSEIRKIEDSVNAWLSSIFVTAALEKDKNFIEKIQDQFGLTESAIKKDIFMKALKELGVSLKTTTATINMSKIDSASTDVLAISSKGSENGKTLQVHFSLKMDFYAVDSGAAFGGTGILSYYVIDSKGEMHKPISSSMLEGFGGTVYYKSVAALAESMKKIALKSVQDVYNELWGNNADKLVSGIRKEINSNSTNLFVKALTSSTLEKVLKKGKITFSNGVFKTFEKMSENSYKGVFCHCPVDVYIYDSENNLCGAIVDNEITFDNNMISMYVEGDEKYIYLMKDDYTVKYIGNDTGTMNVEIVAYVDGEKVRTVTYTDIPLKENITYYGNVPELIYVDHLIMNLRSITEVIQPSSDDWKNIQVSQVFVTGITLNKNTLSIKKGDTEKLSVTIIPENAFNRNVVWNSSNESVITVTNEGIVTAIGVGTAEIAAITEDGDYKAVCTVKVTKSGNKNESDSDSDDDSSSDRSNYNLKPIDTVTSSTGKWMQDQISWWYKNADGSYPANRWQLINDKWYFFNKAGYMVTGWILSNNKWYYLDIDGAMLEDSWVFYKNHWYFLKGGNGDMATGWILWKNQWYYLNADGSMKTGWLLDKDIWYYLNENGDMAVDCTTPDGYQVDSNGAWRKE